MRSLPLTTSRPTTSDGTGEIDLFGILNTLRRGKWVILACVMLALSAAFYYVNYRVTPLYTATATVALQSRNQQVVDVDSVVSGLGSDYFTIYTEVEVLRSRSLITEVVDELNLIVDPDFNPRLAPETEPGFSLSGLVHGGLEAVGLASPLEPGPPPTDAEIRAGIIGWIQGALEISNIEFTRAYRISIAMPNPEDAARIVNAVADQYILDQIAVKYDATEKANAWLIERVAELRTELEAAENRLKAFQATMTLVGPEGLEALNRQAKDFRERIAATTARIEALEPRIAALEAARTSGDPARMAGVANDITLTRTQAMLPDARETFDLRFEALLDRARIELQTAREQVEALRTSLAELDGRVESQSTDLLRLQALQREVEVNRQIYQHFQTRQKETSVQQGIHTPDARVLSPAIVPGGPSSPRKTFTMMVAAVLGAFLGAGLVLLREARQTGFRSSQQLELATGRTVLGQVPTGPFTQRRRLARYLTSKPNSALSESIRNLRTSVMLSNVDREPQLIMVTSSLPGEGKTTLSVALAHSYAAMGKSVLLIEGDIRRRTLRQYFRIREETGLIKAVLGEAEIEDAVHHSEILGIDVLAGERSKLNAADFFTSSRVAEFFAQARQLYDVIIIDTPPVLVVPDARVIGGHADAVLYAVRWNRTTRPQVEEGLGSFDSVDVKITGTVLSQIDMRKARSYGGYYSDLYKSYGGKYYRN